MALRRGFKTEANNIAPQVRAELGLSKSRAVDPWRLASHLAIGIVPLSDYGHDASTAVAHFGSVAPAAFSAVTASSGTL